MTVRAGLLNLIATLRGMCDAKPVTSLGADYKSGGADYWTDEQIQSILDRHRAELNNVFVQPVPRMVNGEVEYHDYYIGTGNLESTLAIENGQGVAYSSSLYTTDYGRGIVSFTNSLTGIVAITGHAYDLNGAAADIWRMKAAKVALSYDISTDNHRLSRSQQMAACLQMAEMYEAMAPITNHKIDRDDTYQGNVPGSDPILHRQMFGGMHPDE